MFFFFHCSRLASALFTLYELVYSNSDFASMLVVTGTESDNSSGGKMTKSPSTASLDSQVSVGADPNGWYFFSILFFFLSLLFVCSLFRVAVSASKGFCRFLTLSSHLLDDAKEGRPAMLVKIIFLTLECLLQNRETAHTICDQKNVRVEVQLYQSKLPHLEVDQQPRDLVGIIFDLLSLFLTHNLRKSFQFDLYRYFLNFVPF